MKIHGPSFWSQQERLKGSPRLFSSSPRRLPIRPTTNYLLYSSDAFACVSSRPHIKRAAPCARSALNGRRASDGSVASSG
eukprot:1192895-Prorocentrum_minimum.AAC.1